MSDHYVVNDSNITAAHGTGFIVIMAMVGLWAISRGFHPGL